MVRYDPRDLSTVFVRRTNGHFVEARYRSLGRPPISLWERNAAVRQLNAKGRRELDEAMTFSSVMEQRSIEDDARRLTARSRRNRERRPVSHQDATVEARLHDIDTAKLPSGQTGSESAWDEPRPRPPSVYNCTPPGLSEGRADRGNPRGPLGHLSSRTADP